MGLYNGQFSGSKMDASYDIMPKIFLSPDCWIGEGWSSRRTLGRQPRTWPKLWKLFVIKGREVFTKGASSRWDRISLHGKQWRIITQEDLASSVSRIDELPLKTPLSKGYADHRRPPPQVSGWCCLDRDWWILMECGCISKIEGGGGGGGGIYSTAYVHFGGESHAPSFCRSERISWAIQI